MSPVSLTTVRTSQAAPPHSVDKSQGDIAHEKDEDSEDCGVSIDDENEVVNVDHMLGVPRGVASLLWRGVWIEFEVHRPYWPAGGINLPRIKTWFIRPNIPRLDAKRRLLWIVWNSCLLRLQYFVGMSNLSQSFQQESVSHLGTDITIFTGAVSL